MPELAKWGGFYAIAGSAAGALIGLQFVVLTLIAARPHNTSPEAGAAFGSPTVVHFGVVLFLAAVMQAPWESIHVVATILGILGLGGVTYTVIVIRRMRSQATYAPIFEDWLCHVGLPLVAYAALALSAIAVFSYERDAFFGVGGAALMLLFIGIHNAWDGVSYHVLVNLVGAHSEQTKKENDEAGK